MTTLAELRQASLNEQKQKEQMQRADAAEPLDPAMNNSEGAPASASGSSAQEADTPIAVPAPEPRALADEVRSLPGAAALGVQSPFPQTGSGAARGMIDNPQPSAPNDSMVKAQEFFDQVHGTLSHKTLHPCGAKVSADMPPALFHRAKRYCLDNGNITLRQVLIDLLTAYLEQEGY